jgi:peptide/nickel transport system permease protein
VRLLRLFAKRVALGVLTVWAVLSVVFYLFAGGKVWNQTRALSLALERPMNELYVDWMTNMFTLQWGESFQSGRDVFSMVMSGTGRTALYVIPAVVLAGVLGLLIGLGSAMKQDARGEGSLRSLSYFGLGLPNFWVGAVLLIVSAVAGLAYTPVFLTGRGEGIPEIAIREWPLLYEYILPILLVATTLLAAIVSYARAYSMQYYADDLTKQVRAKGGGELAVAKHVVRNAAVPLVSLLFAETLALIALSVFVVEAVFAIDGIGSLFYNAVWAQDLPIVMGGTMVFVAVGVTGNFLQDVLHSVLDPRVGTDSL